MKAHSVFQYLRGAIRSSYGIENLRNKTLLIIGMSEYGQKLLNMLCIPGVNVKFMDPKVSNYHKSFAICKDVDVYEGQSADVIVDFTNDYLCVNGKTISMEDIGDNAYTQGIHEFYM
jgi:phosphoglycerate dehydrogenase-like enzyme